MGVHWCLSGSYWDLHVVSWKLKRKLRSTLRNPFSADDSPYEIVTADDSPDDIVHGSTFSADDSPYEIVPAEDSPDDIVRGSILHSVVLALFRKESTLTPYGVLCNSSIYIYIVFIFKDIY